MNRITVWVDGTLLTRITCMGLIEYLRNKGLDTNQYFDRWENSAKPFSQGYRGIALPNKIVGVIKTCVGVIPVTEPWEGSTT